MKELKAHGKTNGNIHDLLGCQHLAFAGPRKTKLTDFCGRKTNHRGNSVCQIWPRLVVAVGHPAGGANMAPAGGTRLEVC